MKKSLVFLFLISITLVVKGDGQQFSFAGNASDINANKAFGFAATKVVVANDSTTDSIWVAFDDCVAVASSSGGFEVKVTSVLGISIDRNEPGWTCIGIIAAAGKTPAYRLGAWKGNP